MATATQARGYKGKVRMMFESEYGVLPADPKAHLLPISSEGLDGGRSQNQKTTLTGKRSPGRSFAGNMDVSGPLAPDANVHATGILLKALCGNPVTTAINDVLNISGSAEDLGAGYVKILCAGHGFRPFTQITISGSTNYDGIYLVDPKSGADDLVIEAFYNAEDFAGTETVRRGAHRKLDAVAAVDKGDGLVGLACSGHGYLAGSVITVTGSTGYDAQYVVNFASSVNEIVVEKAYAAEVFDGTETVSPKYFTHLFKLLDEQPSFALECEVPLDGATDNEAFTLFEGCKVSSFSCSSSGDSQFNFSIDVAGANKRLLAISAAKTTEEFPDFDFKNADSDLILNGEYLTSVTSSSVQISTNLDTSAGYVKGSKGVRKSMPEGAPGVSGSLTAHYKSTALLKKAAGEVEMDYSMGFVTGANQLTLNFPQCLISESGSTPKLSGPQGIVVELQLSGFEDHNEYGTCFYAELINGVSSYT
ncbi:phage tail tube protein [Maridesulfovibrio ferrireducens]|uniref:phage tail tube protein n=1 Tax=Maridesulfovibrio ferrireducens TaxID=246191 RepID=UPI001A1FDF4D|nr:phage tail tube protein [Maridesulfovibrio ferrireducens]MBI9110003.1 hypothetical protein [Maridesulfovibrio ferrireducens]